ncbi:MAG: AI-2E family transporter [Clostridia bacterium]|nr:AI-2E family transporter [Clostridia bacterium]
MKFDWNKKYTTIAIYAVIAALVVVFAVFFFINYSDFGSYLDQLMTAIRPLIIGTIIAYLMNPVMRLFENNVFAFVVGEEKIPTVTDDMKPKKRARVMKKIERIRRRREKQAQQRYEDGVIKTHYGLRRGLSVACAAIVSLLIIAAFFYILIPQVASGVNELSLNMSSYIASVQQWLVKISATSSIFSSAVKALTEYLNELISTVYKVINDVIPVVTSALKGIILTIKDILIGIFFAIYLLAGKERVAARLKKLLRAIFSDKIYNGTLNICTSLNKSFGSFIAAKLLDSFIIGFMTFFILMIIGMPYYPLIAVVVGVTNIVPIFGPIIGAIPCAFIVFIVDPPKTIVFIIFIVILQQFDGNILGPKLLGAQVNATALSILTSLTVLSSFWGITGLIIAVPLFVVVYAFVKKASENRLASRGMSSDTIDYYGEDDDTGRSLYLEAQIKEAHKKSLMQMHLVKKMTSGRGALARSTANVVQKIDERAEKFQTAESDAIPTKIEQFIDDAEKKLMADIDVDMTDDAEKNEASDSDKS